MSAVVKCSECRNRCHCMAGWNIVYSDGDVTGYLCPDCQPADVSAAEAV